jgi:DNA polymerase-3 subunit delta'
MSLSIHFPGLLGQERLKRQLQAGAANDRLSHAYLLLGPQGSGRSTLALNLFMALNCERRGRQESPCQECPSCQRAIKRQHENLIIIEPDTQAGAQISVDSLRQALRALAFPPLSQGVRLILIRPAERLNQEGGNALLKSLEEPPPGNLIMLCAQDSTGLLPTLVSRCCRLNLQPLSLEVMFKELQEKGCSHIPARIALSGGYLGQALSMDPEQINDSLAWLPRSSAATDALPELWALAREISARFRTGKDKTMDRQGLIGLLECWGQYYRDRAVSQAGRPELALLDRVEGSEDLGLSRALDNFNWVRWCQNQILANAQPDLALTVLLNRLG